MEYEVSIKSDAPSIYRRLASYYSKRGEKEKIQSLIKTDEEMNLITTKSLIADLNGYLND